MGFPVCWVGAACLHVLRESSILHLSDMTKPAQAPLRLSGDSLDLTKAAHVERVESTLLVDIEGPSFTARKQSAEPAAL